MPVFEGLVSRLCEKLEEVRISELNHELGKAKDNFLSDLSLIRSESVHRIGGLFFASPPSSVKGEGLPKSASLPVFPGEKYRYRSCKKAAIQEEESGGDIHSSVSSLQSQVIDENVVSKFIQVVESPSPRLTRKKHPQNSREDILKKLAFSTEERPKKTASKDLELCYINKTISEEDEDIYLNPVLQIEEEDVPLPSTEERPENPADFAKQIRQLQKEATSNLENCRLIAERKINSEKVRRRSENPLSKLGIQESSLKSKLGLGGLNIPTLQVIVNHHHSQIQSFNEDLVGLLLEKDELSIEQEGQLLDIEDLTLKIQGN
eukprot:TRINITY_DN5572_c0_g1_i3.p1 TRINITY_DN5572_c0_g1~~TRINITY_DN5572_c0_g1_i3.p1  ORF type:complete len:320 (-),score=118.67 TRINITY_DN5572_c0_g1_i3:1653-2612(-)